MGKLDLTFYDNDMSGAVLVKSHDFWAILPNGADKVIELGLDAIMEDCLRINWEEIDSSELEMNFRTLHPIFDWATAIHEEWETL